jgi:hypothetical protein
MNENFFFARKFNPMLDNQLLNTIDQSLFGLYSPGK